MAVLMQDFGTFSGLHMWCELEDDTFGVGGQTRLLLFVKNENNEVAAKHVDVKMHIQPQGPIIMPNPIMIEKIVPGRTIRETLLINSGDSEGRYALRMGVDFQLVPATWVLGPLPFQIHRRRRRTGLLK